MYCTKTENGVRLFCRPEHGPVEVKDYFSTVKVREDDTWKIRSRALVPVAPAQTHGMHNRPDRLAKRGGARCYRLWLP